MGRVVLAPFPKGKATGILHPSRRRRRKGAVGARSSRVDNRETSANACFDDPTEKSSSVELIDLKMRSIIHETTHIGKGEEFDGAVGDFESTVLPTTLARGRLALAIDTRLLVDEEAPVEDVEEKCTNMYKRFLDDMASAGVLPFKLSCTAPAEESKSLVLETETIRHLGQLKTMSIKPVVYVSDLDKLSALPKQFLVKNTWKLFRGLIDSLYSIDGTGECSGESTSPMDITLLMRTASLVGDSTAHIEGFEAAIGNLRTYFESSKMQSISIILIGNSNEEDLVASSLQSSLEKLLHPSSGNEDDGISGLPLDISIHVIDDNYSGIKKVVRQMVRQSLKSSESGNLAIDLPETGDGTQCQLLLEMKYNLCATSLQNQTTWGDLAQDMHVLSSSLPLQVQQLVPYSSLDASLLFGVPIRLTVGTQTQDWHDYQTMQVLFKSLLRFLQERDTVLLLQVPDSTAGGVWLGRPGQTLVLMAREVRGTNANPQSALLWGYANASQCLLEEEGMPNSGSLLDEETTEQLAGYVEASLEHVVCGPYNPLVNETRDLRDTFASTQDNVSSDGSHPKDE